MFTTIGMRRSAVIIITFLIMTCAAWAAGSKSSERVRVGGNEPVLGTPHTMAPQSVVNDPRYDGYARGSGYSLHAAGIPVDQAFRSYNITGFGSGFAVSNDGTLVTNHHVIDAVLDDGGIVLVRDPRMERVFTADILRHDEKNDLAVLKMPIQTLGLPVTQQADIRVGEEVVALGFPKPQQFGFSLKVTFGRVNTKNPLSDVPAFMQIDAPIHAGNSGGPTISRSGQVVGVNSAIMPDSLLLEGDGRAVIDMAQNVGYAIKSEYVTRILSGLVSPVQYNPRAQSNMQDLVAQVERSVYQILIAAP